MTYTVIHYLVTEKKCIRAIDRTIVSTVLPSDYYYLVTIKQMISCKHECLGEVMVIIDPIFTRMHRV